MVKFSPSRVTKSELPYGNSPRQALGCLAEDPSALAKIGAQPLAKALAPVLQLEHLGVTNESIPEAKAE